MKPGRLIIILIIFNLCALPVFGDSSGALKLGLVLIDNPQEEQAVEALCDTATASIEFTLRLINRYHIDRLDFLLPTQYQERAEIYLKKNNYDYAVFGEITHSDEGYAFSLKCWERQSDSVILNLEQRAGSIFDTFDIVDELSTNLIEQLVGEHIGFGTAEFMNTGLEAEYDVYVDGNFLGSNLTESEILSGERTFRIEKSVQDGYPAAQTIAVNIPEGGSVTVEFSIPEPKAEISQPDYTPDFPAGNLNVSSKPSGASIFLDGEFLGRTPKSLFGVEEGIYSLSLVEEYYLTGSSAVSIAADEDTDIDLELQLDFEHPEVASELVQPLPVELSAAVLTAGQVVYYLMALWNMGGTEVVGFNTAGIIFSSMRYGHLLAGDELMGGILTAASFASVLLTGYDPFGGGSLHYWIGIPGFFAAVLWDLIDTPMAVARQNEQKKERWQAEGFEPDDEDGFGDLELTCQFGGGGLMHVGIAYWLLNGWAGGECLLGIAFSEMDNSGDLAFPFTLKALFMPFPSELELLKPYLGADLVLSFGADSAAAIGVFSGFEFELSNTAIYIESGFHFNQDNGSVPMLLSAGVRL